VDTRRGDHAPRLRSSPRTSPGNRPDDVPAHPYAVAMEVVRLAPKAEVSIYPWKEPKDLIPRAVRHVRDFLQAHQPVTAAR
jgi:hypothetical protein